MWNRIGKILENRKWTFLLVLIILYIFCRTLTIFTPLVSHWGVMVDETPTGNITHDLGRELVVELPRYQFKPFAAGTLIEGLVAYPFVKLFGHNLLALKSAAVVFGIGTLIFIYLLLWRLTGPIGAVVAGALLVFAPMGYQNLTTTAWGNHTESSFFTALGLFLLIGAYQRRNFARDPSLLMIAAAGLVLGFGAYFTYTGLISVLFGFLLIVLVGGIAQWQGPVWVYFGGAAFGFSPFIASMRIYNFDALGSIDTYRSTVGGVLVKASNLFLESSPSQIPGKFFAGLFRELPKSFCFGSSHGLSGQTLSFLLAAFVGLFLIAYVLLKRKDVVSLAKKIASGKKSRDDLLALFELSLPGFVLFYLLMYAISGFRVNPIYNPYPGNFTEYRYFAPLYPFFAATAGLAVAVTFKKAVKVKALGAGVLVIVSVVLLLMATPIFSMGNVKQGFRVMEVRSDFYSLIVKEVAAQISKHERQLPGKVLWVKQLSPKYHPLFFETLAKISPASFEIAQIVAARIDENLEPFAYRGYGHMIGQSLTNLEKGDPVEVVDRVMSKYSEIQGKNRSFFLEGIGEGLYFALQPYLGQRWNQTTLVNWPGFWNTVEKQDHPSILAGIGRGIGDNFALEDFKEDKMPPDFWRGVGKQLRRNAEIQLLRNDLAIDCIENLPPEAKVPVLQGWQEEGREMFLERTGN